MNTQDSNPSLEGLGISPTDHRGEDDHADAEGYLYIIEYSTGLVKPGRATRPDVRISEHKGSVGRYGIEITRKWVSQLHAGYYANEAALLDYCNRNGRRAGRSEFYSDMSFDDIQAFARQLSFPKPIMHIQRQRECAEVTSRFLSAHRVAFSQGASTSSNSSVRKAAS